MADIILKNDRLKVTVSEPGSLYRRQRFDWCGVVTEVLLDEKHSFLSKEPPFYGQITGGHGLSSNFEAANGFEYGNTPIGEYFPRVGVGRIIRHDRSPLSMYHDYTIDPAPMRWEQPDESCVVFHTDPVPCNGYAFSVEKTIQLKGNAMETEYSLTNVGEKSVALEEANHNYTMIDGIKVDKDYELTTPYNMKINVGRGAVTHSYNKLRVDSYDDFFIFDVGGWEGCTPHSWRVEHTPTGLAYGETVYAPLSKFFVWGCHNNFCPIVYVRCTSVPGQTNRWVRKLQFWDKQDK